MKNILLIVLALVAAPLYAGSGDKVVGDGFWLNSKGAEMYASFSAIDGKKGVKGSFTQQKLSGAIGQYTVGEVDYVDVQGSTACISGRITEASGLWASLNGGRVWVVMQDGGSGTEERGDDLYRASLGFSSIHQVPTWCSNPNFAANQPFTGGNVQIN